MEGCERLVAISALPPQAQRNEPARVRSLVLLASCLTKTRVKNETLINTVGEQQESYEELRRFAPFPLANISKSFLSYYTGGGHACALLTLVAHQVCLLRCGCRGRVAAKKHRPTFSS